MKTNRKINALCACSLLTMALLPTACSTIDDNRDDCYIDLQADYELHLVTNETSELTRTLGDRPGIAEALRQHLSGVLSDQGRDLNLSFYYNGTRAYQQTEAMNNAPSKRVNMLLDIKDYEHLTIANVQGNNVVTLEGDNTLQTSILKSQTSNQEIPSQKTGIFTGRRSFQNMTYGNYPCHISLYMANCAAALVLDPRTAKFTDVKIYTTGFATSFSVADSTYQFESSPLVRAESVAMPDTTRWIAFCGVSFPSKEPATPSRETRSRVDTDQPFSYADSGKTLWQYDCYVTMVDGSITQTTIGIHHPLRGGQLKVLRAYIDDQGKVRIYDNQVGATVDIDWNTNTEIPVII